MAIYGRFGCTVTILRKAVLEDVKKLDKRKPDQHDRERIKLGMYLVVKLNDGTTEDSAERLYEYCYLRADGGVKEIDAAIAALEEKTPTGALERILKIAFKHEVQYWLDEPGTDAEKLARIVSICREALAEEAEARPEGSHA